jgi:putative N6-adenine-specific DNA methylase
VAPRLEAGGVEFEGSLADVARANLHLRTATRVLVRLGDFHARALGELERRGRLLPWSRYLAPGQPVRLRVTSRKSRLYHQGAIAERLASAIAAESGAVPEPRGGGDPDDESGADAQLIVVRMLRDECVVSLDSSGELLHRRGYRAGAGAGGKAPLRETLAAAMLLASGWDPGRPLVDPFAGSGTIPIEAALLARRIPPGLSRRFAFQTWPETAPDLWPRIVSEARERILPQAPAPILGSDRDAGAVATALANAERAGVSADVVFRRAALSALEPPADPGWLVTNPPYGKRVGARGDLRDLYAQLGNVARRSLSGWTVSLLVPSTPLERQTGLRFEERLATTNGGLAVRVVAAGVA